MKTIVKNITNCTIIVSVLAILLGIVLVAYPGVSLAALGCLVIWSPVVSAMSLTIYIGLIIIAYSLVNIVYMFIIKKNVKNVEKLIAEKAVVIKSAAEPEAETEGE